MAQPQSGTKGRAWLESSQVQQSGLTAREAQAVVAAVLDAIKKKACARMARSQRSLGESHTTSRTQSYQRKRPEPKTGTGLKAIYEQTLHQQRTCVRFKPDPGWIGKGETA